MGNFLKLSFIFTSLAFSYLILSGNSELIRCKVCFGPVSFNAASCPHCGEPEFKPPYRVIEKESLQDRATVFYAVNDTKPYTGWVVDGRYVNGRPKIEQEYRDGKKWGIRRKWYENGQLMQRSQYEEGVLEGKMLEWHENGAVMADGVFVDGKLHGLVRRWFSDGKKEAEYPYQEGKLDGILIQWNRRGNMIGKKKYEAGKLLVRMAVDPPVNTASASEDETKTEASTGTDSSSNVFEGLQLGFPQSDSAN